MRAGAAPRPQRPEYLAAMGIIAQILIEAAERSDHERLERAVEERLGVVQCSPVAELPG